MMGPSNKPLNPFRKQNPPSTPSNSLHSRWGDVSISVPTNGSWSQHTNSRRPTRHKRGEHGLRYTPEHSPPARHRHRRHYQLQSEDEDGSETTASTSTDTSTTSSRRNSVLVNTLNPARHISLRRRLSSRVPRHAHSPAPSETQFEDITDEKEDKITEKRNEFAYKPISQDYPTEVAESQTRSQGKGSHAQSQRQNHPHRTNTNTSTRFRYIPASKTAFREEFGDIPARSQSGCSGSGSGSSRSRESRYSLSSSSGVSDGLRREPGRSRSRGSERKDGMRTGGDRLAEKRLSYASSKYLTTAMVPDPDDLYE